MSQRTESVEALELMLGETQVGIVVHYAGGKNILSFDPAYSAMQDELRPTLTLTQQLTPDYLKTPLIRAQKLPPVLSNLLPEGALRGWMASALKTHPDNEFPLLAWAGGDLPGALIARPVPIGHIPTWALSSRESTEPVQIDVKNAAQKFSLAGVQMKFSSSRRDGRFNLGKDNGNDKWIIKTPSTIHPGVPENEYSVMKLAQTIGVQIPEIELIALDKLDNLPTVQLPDEPFAYAIKRFDRTVDGRVHTEDFAQIFELYPHDKYGRRNYDQIARTLYRFGADGLQDAQQMTRRLLANILLGNGDAHLKNWSLIYPDRLHPVLSPAYDIVSTLPYVTRETDLALNMAKQKNWYAIDQETFHAWAQRVGLPWPAIRVHLLDALERARNLWPSMLDELPMQERHKKLLRAHWSNLAQDFRLK